MSVISEREPALEVTVCIIAYNQEKYIRQCLQSIIDQKTNFDFDVIVGDDCSTDGTQEIIKEFASKFPAMVRTIFQEKNTGGTRNYLDVHRAARGKYVAHIDGDDYMLPTKLQKQVDVFRAHSNLSMVVHGANILDEQTGRFLRPVKRFYGNRIENMEFLLRNLPYFAHSSKMYKRVLDEDFDYKGKEIIDCFFHIFHASKGDIYMIPEELVVYRRNVGLSTVREGTGVVVNPLTSEYLHEAIDSASKFGVDNTVILKSHAQAALVNAISHLRSANYPEYQCSIARSVAYKKMSVMQFTLYFLKGAPVFSRLLWVSIRWTALNIRALRVSGLQRD